ncbi:tectonic-3-like [Melanotaenia boesemani]|uniref:tectonic-3-like n=1 Tax=Melanotaenia boesemani TaxID=1250792 RepID=UPI001C0400A1|nr:tectonic-3-like [Melanotaenia boesemani]
MIFCSWGSFHVFFVLLESLAHATTALGATSTVNSNPTKGEPFSSVTPTPGVPGTVNSADGPTEEVTLYPTVGSTVTATLSVSEAPTTMVTEAPMSAQGCLCNLTPDFCDIGCCCDTADCDVANLSTVFTGCPQPVISGVCIEKWLMFRANMNASLLTVTDSMFCVRSEDGGPKSLPRLPQFPTLGDLYYFSPPKNVYITHTRDFYRVDDAIQTFFPTSSVRSVLRQPSPGTASTFCMNRNPAKFLRSTSLSCTQSVTSQSCTTDPNLNAQSYFSDLTLLKIPTAETVISSDFPIPVTPRADWPAPTRLNSSCVDVVKRVEFIIGYTGRGELTYAVINVELADVDFDQLLLQTHSVHFQLATPSPTPGELTPPVGLKVGSPVIGRADGKVQPLTSLGLSQGGECSSELSSRAQIHFAHNTITGCTFRSPANNCSELRSQIYRVLQGLSAPDVIAMNSGSEPDWTRVILQECPISLEETCETGCILPHSLYIKVLWARQGIIDFPQNYLLGAKYQYQCQNVKCPLLSPVVLTTSVAFVETTEYQGPPRGLPQPFWKFPFAFFTRGTAELDGHFVTSGCNTEKVTWSLTLFTVMLLTGLEFFTS